MRATKKIDAMLVQKCCNVAKRRGDEFNGFLFGQMNPVRMTEAERRNCNVYLFGSDFDRMTLADLERLP